MASLRCALRMLDRIHREHRELEWNDWLSNAYREHRQQATRQTAGDLAYASGLGSDLAGLLGADRATCFDLARELVMPNMRDTALRALKSFIAYVDSGQRRAG